MYFLIELLVPLSWRTHIPNILTFARMVGTAPIIGLFTYSRYGESSLAGWGAFVLFALFAATDYLDGRLAHRWNAKSAFGERWDPIADKIVVCSLLAMLVAYQEVWEYHVIPAVIILVREPLVEFLRTMCMHIKVPSTLAAKQKTTLQLLALGFLMTGVPLVTGPYANHVWVVGAVLLWLGATLSLLTGLDYLARVWRPFDRYVGWMLTFAGVRPKTAQTNS